ncbi:MAG: thiamine phosphate synthase [Bacteroidales bacterium]
MNLYVITSEVELPNEHRLIDRLFELGMERLHIRKPTMDRETMCRYLSALPEKWHSRLVLHDHHELASEFEVGGIHLNRRNPIAIKPFGGSVSRSCHSLDELGSLDTDYCFLSPLFDSLSKQGYHSAFLEEELSVARDRGWINNRVVALGGITPESLSKVKEWGFGGVAVLGYLWESDEVEKRYLSLVQRISEQG